jgi:IS5 family transposase
VIEVCRRQLNFAEGLIAEEVGELWEDWMRQVDEVLTDPELVSTVYGALARRWPMSRTRGRKGTPAEVVLRLLLLKHIRNWSYAILEREVRANLVYRQFTRVGADKVPDAKTLGKLGLALGPAVIDQIHQRVVAIAREKKIVAGRRLRVDTTVVETDIHYPTDSSLLGDAVRVLTRTMKKVAQLAGAAGEKLRDRSRSVRHRLIEIGRASRSRSEQGKAKLTQTYHKLLALSGRVVAQAQRFANEVAAGVKHATSPVEQVLLETSRQYLETMIPRIRQVIRQTRERVIKGNAHLAGKIVSLFEPHTEVIRKGKAGKPTEFGKMIKIQEAERQIIIHYQAYDQRPNDVDLLLPAIEVHRQRLGRVPRLASADAAFFSTKNEAAAHAIGVKRLSIPNRSSKSEQRKKLERKRWFRNGQKWRTGCEGRISLVKRRHGLDRCRYKGQHGMQRWVGLGVIGDNLINIGRALAASAKT